MSDLAKLIGGAAAPGTSKKIEPKDIDCDCPLTDGLSIAYQAIVTHTDRAVLFRFEAENEELWVPKSVLIGVGDELFEVAEWWAEREGLI